MLTQERETPVTGAEDQLPRPVRPFPALLAGLSLLCGAVELVCGWVLHLAYPYIWPLMPLRDRFWDFSLYKARFAYFQSPQFFTFDGPGYFYPAPLATMHWLLYLMPASTRVFLCLLLTVWLVAAVLLGRLLTRRGVTRCNVTLEVGTAALCSYPFLFEFEQANLEWILCVLVGKDSKTRRYDQFVTVERRGWLDDVDGLGDLPERFVVAEDMVDWIEVVIVALPVN